MLHENAEIVHSVMGIATFEHKNIALSRIIIIYFIYIQTTRI